MADAGEANGVAKQSSPQKAPKEGAFLLGSPSFKPLANGRLKCVESGHELLEKDKASYALTKACRIALIDAAVAKKKPPLNMFEIHPESRLQLVCKLTGVMVNKSEEHIWKHINGRKFLNKLEQKEMEKHGGADTSMKEAKKPKAVEAAEKETKKSKKREKLKKTGIKQKEKRDMVGNGSLTETTNEDGSDGEELDFWEPPVGSRWDFDDGKDRWGSCEDEDGDSDDGNGEDKMDEEDDPNSVELTMRMKRTSIAVGPSSFASRKKKVKKMERPSKE